MTIDEAIQHQKNIVEKYKYQLALNETGHPMYALGDKEIPKIEKYVEEYTQVAEWLEELKFLQTTKETMFRKIYNQALEDFYKALQKNQQDNWIDNLEYGITFSDVEEVISKLKNKGVFKEKNMTLEFWDSCDKNYKEMETDEIEVDGKTIAQIKNEAYNQALEDFEKCAIQQSEYMETEEGWCGMVVDTKIMRDIKEQLKK